MVLEKIIHLKPAGTEIPEKLQSIPFVDLFWPWMEVARETIKRHSKISSEAFLAFEINLIRSLTKFCTPSLVLEMHLKENSGQLQGETTREAYLSYVRDFLQNPGDLKAFFDEYQVLASLIETTFDLWQRKTEEFIERLAGDWTALEEFFNQGKPLGFLEKLDCALSDPHMGNKSVLGLTFSSGVSLFYKPKSLGMDKAFNAFIKRINEFNVSCPLKTYRVLNCGDYGWVEKIHHLPCESIEQVELYFKRAGMLLCLAYLFGGTDFHYENIISEIDQPVLIDLETLFNPTIRKASPAETNPKWRSSVLKTLMLPRFVMGRRGRKGVDLSGLTGGQKGASYPSDAAEWEDVNTVQMKLVYHLEKSVNEGKNLVFLNKQLQSAADYVPQIIDGFKEMYALLLKHRKILFEEERHLDLLCDHPVRLVCRPTSLYAKLMHQMTDPSMMRNERAVQEIRTILPRYFIEEHEENLIPIVENEFQALTQRDIPFFRCYPKKLDIFFEDKVIVPNALRRSPYEETLQRINEMDEADCSLQLEFIRNSFYCVPRAATDVESQRNIQMAHQGKDLSEEEIFHWAIKIGERILSRAFRSQSSGLSWIGIEPYQEDQLSFDIIGETLYGGNLGIALFFAALYAKTKETKWKEAAQDALGCILQSLKPSQIEFLPAGIGLGGMLGIGGIVYVFGKISSFLQEPRFLHEALHLLNFVNDKHFEKDTSLDVIGGSAGLLLALLSLPGEELHPLTYNAAEHLIDSRSELEGGQKGWKTIDGKARIGFAHGAAGIGFSLMKVFLRTGKPQYKEMALEAFNFERQLYSVDKCNWPVFFDGINYENVTWCNGATGIGLSRLSLYSITTDKMFLREVENALTISSKYLMKGPHHLCCGTAGRIEFLNSASQILNRNDLKILAKNTISSIIIESENEGGFNFFPSLPADAYTPSFMKGEAGIGYCLLRFTDKDNCLPNVLLLE